MQRKVAAFELPLLGSFLGYDQTHSEPSGHPAAQRPNLRLIGLDLLPNLNGPFHMLAGGVRQAISGAYN